MDYAPQDGKWQVGPHAHALHRLRQQMSPDDFEQDKRALQEFLCGYFSSVNVATPSASRLSQ